MTNLGAAELAAGRGGDARRQLERALTMQKPDEGDPHLWAKTAFALARALRHEKAEPERAQQLAHQALDIFAGSGAGWVAEADDVRRWLRKR
jgi:Flp pilus assembly protein TadD